VGLHSKIKNIVEAPIMHAVKTQKMNTIDFKYMKLNLRLAWNLIAGIQNIASKSNSEQELEFNSKYEDLFSSYPQLY